MRVALFAPTKNAYVYVGAKLDTCSEYNCIHPDIIDKGGFAVEQLSPEISFGGASGTAVFTHKATIKWQSFTARKDCTTDFYIVPKNCDIQILLGQNFIREHKVLQWSKEPHLFVSSHFLLSLKASQLRKTVLEHQ